jgi:hypothetical protein
VIVASFRLKDARLSQEVDATAIRLARNPATITALNPPLWKFIVEPPSSVESVHGPASETSGP